jgi:hypothetical protein
MNFDIAPLLEQWDFVPGQVVVRKFKGRDGRDKIQLRVDLGLLQMNAEGRPDGRRPLGRESLFEHFKGQLEKHRAAHGGNEEGFRLSAEDCARLQQEAIQYHHRYLCLFQLGDFAGVVRDADRNIAVFDFVARHAESEELAWTLDQFRPQLLLMRTRALGSVALAANRHGEAVAAVEAGLELLREFYRRHSRTDLMDHSGEIESLQGWLLEIQSSRPLSEREKLESDLEDAVRREDYEAAARVRDALRNLKPAA